MIVFLLIICFGRLSPKACLSYAIAHNNYQINSENRISNRLIQTWEYQFSKSKNNQGSPTFWLVPFTWTVIPPPPEKTNEHVCDPSCNGAV